MPGDTVEILVVEDSPTQAQHLARLLTSEPGWKVRIAGDGSAALAEVARRRPHLVISDIAMPGMDGFTLCRTLKEDPVYANLPVVLLTRLSSLNDIVQALESGADSFVRKPYDGMQLRERLRRILQDCALGSPDRPLEFMAAERRQIYELLVATHAQALRMNAELAEQRASLERSVRSLAILHGMAAALNEAVGEQAVAEAALAHLLAMPGLAGAAVGALRPNGALRMLAAPPHHLLTPREGEIVALIGAGLQVKQVAAELGISISSVNTYRSRIFRKMGLSSNAALIRYALRHGLAG